MSFKLCNFLGLDELISVDAVLYARIIAALLERVIEGAVSESADADDQRELEAFFNFLFFLLPTGSEAESPILFLLFI